MHATSYFNTLIEVSEDCPARVARIPPKPETVAGLHHRFALSMPALLSAPSEKSISSGNSPLLAGSAF